MTDQHSIRRSSRRLDWGRGQQVLLRNLVTTIEGAVIRRVAPAVEHTHTAILIETGIQCEVMIRRIAQRATKLVPFVIGAPSREEFDRLRERVSALEFDVESQRNGVTSTEGTGC